ncbi:MAG: hypothetical protein KDC23_01475 [Actinobacteria bacterium]|nr:hypothetical protein [Actinomycetota bacterium]
MSADTFRNDQVAAAEEQMTEAFGLLRLMGFDNDPVEPSPALRARRVEWSLTSRVAGCPHTTDPQPLFGLIHDPGVVYCAPCGALAAEHRATIAPDECDVCGGYAQVFIETGWRFGAVLVHGNICGACHEAGDVR